MHPIPTIPLLYIIPTVYRVVYLDVQIGLLYVIFFLNLMLSPKSSGQRMWQPFFLSSPQACEVGLADQGHHSELHDLRRDLHQCWCRKEQ